MDTQNAAEIQEDAYPKALTLSAKTPSEAKLILQKQGITLKQFAQMHKFAYRTVSEVVRGVNKGMYGEGHKVAVAFGLKSA